MPLTSQQGEHFHQPSLAASFLAARSLAVSFLAELFLEKLSLEELVRLMDYFPQKTQTYRFYFLCALP